MRKPGSSARLLISAIMLASGLHAFQAPQSEFDTSTSEMRPLIERFAADRASLTRAYVVPLAPSRHDRFKQYFTDWETRLGRLNFDSMSQDGKVDYVLLRNRLDHELRQLELDAKAQADAAGYVSFSQAILTLEEKRRKLDPVDPKQAAAALTALAKQVNDAHQAAESQMRGQASPDPAPIRRVLAKRAADEIATLRNTLRAWFNFYDGYDPLFTWWCEEAYRTADSALQSYRAFLRERVAGLRPEPAEPAAGAGGRGGRGGAGAGALARAGDSSDIIGDPIGRDGLLSELANEMIPYTPRN